jgi:diadenosine tetraphosphate (Ap4A) HIT family hydrolase
MSCLFCDHEKLEIITENQHCVAVRDKSPVTKLHTLIISRRCVETPFELTRDEMFDVLVLADRCRQDILQQDESVSGFNFGANVGATAGQKIMHVHFHLIPRRSGDMAPPPAQEA